VVIRTSFPSTKREKAGLPGTILCVVAPLGGLESGVCAAAIDDAKTVRATDKAATRDRNWNLPVM
jgi:hypothetical protein